MSGNLLYSSSSSSLQNTQDKQRGPFSTLYGTSAMRRPTSSTGNIPNSSSNNGSSSYLSATAGSSGKLVESNAKGGVSARTSASGRSASAGLKTSSRQASTVSLAGSSSGSVRASTGGASGNRPSSSPLGASGSTGGTSAAAGSFSTGSSGGSKPMTESVDKKRDITIHVFDENRNAKKDFICKQHILLREMNYFSEYLNDRPSTPSSRSNSSAGGTHNQVDIDVHCDIEVFEWLMSYVAKQKPLLEPRTAISILISSNFLQMSGLEDVCLKYVHDHVNEIVKVPIDMNCISKVLFAKLAKLFSISDLARIVDPKDKITSKLYMHKLTHLLTHPSQCLPPLPTSTSTSYPPPPSPLTFRRCTHCASIYPTYLEPFLPCASSIPLLDFNGGLHSLHAKDPDFDWNLWAAKEAFIEAGGGWKGVFWRVVGMLHYIPCKRCESLFPLGLLSETEVRVVDEEKGIGGTMAQFNPFEVSPTCKTHNPAALDLPNRTLISLFKTSGVTPPHPPNPYTPTEKQEGSNVRIFGTWSPQVFARRDSQDPVRMYLSEPTGLSSSSFSLADLGKGVQKVPQYIQRDEDVKMAAMMTRHVIKFREEEKAYNN
ncbi:hypothetical protein HDV05_006795 [Chytridiales sp. JEL 0842]|nr:hypothetical protein HDV05_006795 [Chytridiales sp. JEL 0842]